MDWPRPSLSEALLALVLALVAAVEIWTDDAFAGHRPALTALAVVLAVALVWRVRAPLAVALIAVAGGIVLAMAIEVPDDDPMTVVVMMLIALYSAGAHLTGRRAVAGGLLAAAAVTSAALGDEAGVDAIGDVMFYAVIVGAPWAAGLAIRLLRQRERSLATHAATLEREGEERARAAVAEERERIARELHDVVAHGISVMVVQARGGRRALESDRQLARGAFDAIEQAGSESLAEMRRLLGMLRRADDELALAPQPTLRAVAALAEQMTEAGLPVTLEVEGEARDLPAGVDLSAYRIVQEALTNALRHAGPATAHVRIRYAPDGVELEIADTGRGPSSVNGGGHGLVGMRERARLYGGEVQADATREGGFRVRARLPLHGAGG